MKPPFLPFDPDGEPEDADTLARQSRLRDIPLRAIFPNMLTLLAICAGMTAIRFAVDGRLELAVAAIILAAILDGIDGRVARFLSSSSRFGAQMDSLADFVNFGVAPAMLLYFALLSGIGPVGWLAALFFALCACLRLARFNVMIDAQEQQSWQKAFFVGVPAPAGALVVLAPVYLLLLGLPLSVTAGVIAAAYAVIVGLLMVSRLPTFSGKNVGQQIGREYVLPALLLAVMLIAALLSWPWQTLFAATLAYLGALPLAFRAWRARSASLPAENRPASETPDN